MRINAGLANCTCAESCTSAVHYLDCPAEWAETERKAQARRDAINQARKAAAKEQK